VVELAKDTPYDSCFIDASKVAQEYILQRYKGWIEILKPDG